ncbi:MAG: hypothetical protein R2941_24250 [Desulfobacterales bacterium]
MQSSRFHIIIIFFFLLGSVIFVQGHYSEKRYRERVLVPECPWCDARETQEDIVYIPINSSLMRLLSPADPHFLADILWMRTSYYFGSHALTDRKYTYLFHLLDIITDLSPEWENPYLFGAVILPTEGEAVEDGLYLIEKGIVHHPQMWELWFFKGYFLWKEQGDIIGGAEALHKASLLPRAPIYLAKLSATLATQEGQKELAIRFLEQALENIEDPNQRKILIQKMEKIQNE